MPAVVNRDYRTCAEFRAADDENFIVDGYATTFNEPYSMGRYWDGTECFEVIDGDAFNETDMRDVIMQYDHTGRVLARNKNGTLSLSVDDHGLRVRADLSKSDAGRSLYEDIKNGLIDQMSFGFTVEEDSWNNETYTRRILKIAKLYDVSAVSIPANPNTEISARDYFNGVLEMSAAERRSREEIERKRKTLALLLEI